MPVYPGALISRLRSKPGRWAETCYRLFSTITRIPQSKIAYMPHQRPEIGSERQIEPYSFSKDKLPKALSYPLKRSVLDAVLWTSSVYDAIWYVHYSGHQNSNTLLRAHFHAEQDDFAARGKVMLTVWAVRRNERKITEELLVRDGLPLLCEWLAKAKLEGNSWRGFVHIIDFERKGATLRIVEPGERAVWPHIRDLPRNVGGAKVSC